MGLCFPDLALVPETVLDDETGLGLDTGLLPRALGWLVGLVVLAWISHGLSASHCLPLDADGRSGPAGRLGALAADFLAGLVADPTVTADLPHEVDILVLGKADVSAKEMPGLTGIDVLGTVCHPPGDLARVLFNCRAEPVDCRLVHAAKGGIFIDFRHTGDDRRRM